MDLSLSLDSFFKLRWEKLGPVAVPFRRGTWRANSGLTPTAISRDTEVARVYCGFRDDTGVSRIGFVDLEKRNPLSILAVSEKPCLDVGQPGAFDDNGVILGDVWREGAEWLMSYVGFQLVQKAKFLAFSGVARSADGTSFERVHRAPWLDRSDEGLYIRAAHTVRPGSDGYDIWYAADDGWETIGGKPFPRYEIHYQTRPSLDESAVRGERQIALRSPEYRIGRPKVYRLNDGWLMFYTKGHPDGTYLAGVATSSDGRTWNRQDERFPLSLSTSGADDRHLCYPVLLETQDGLLMIYNGNNMGAEGFLIARGR